ncbi:hypothetical protein BDZ91DRAFT_489899 [Kalaharituber pfeilii]|nr:hypothetical protein BDZ91DRAFT_489899 [Kalaharituber pfeilii]
MSSSASSAGSHQPSGAPPNPKARIINDMNADHSDSLRLYLTHFSKIPPPSPSTILPDPTLIDISLEGLTISHHLSPQAAAPAITFIQFDPPLASLSEARARLVAMTEEAQEAVLGSKSEQPHVDVVTLPTLYGWFIAAGVINALIFFAPGIVDKYTLPPPGTNPAPEGYPEDLPYSWYTRTFLFGFPPLIRLLSQFRYLFWGVVLAAHIVEGAILDKRLVGKYGVKRGSGVWFGWMWWAFLEGYPALQRAEGVWRGLQAGKKKA